ncbi:DUF3987 domain-containing protein [Streptomyces sp. DSM 118148]|uniref:DUF3987 domain-containing protein n=1 Tax=Streptomyces sp. DSM 118148 TaxID=3448667 RepID=UPI0040401E4B
MTQAADIEVGSASTSSSTSPAAGTTGSITVKPDPEQTIAFLKALYPTLPQGVVSWAFFTVSDRIENRHERLAWHNADGTYEERENAHEWLAAKLIRNCETTGAKVFQRRRRTVDEHSEYGMLVPVTGVFLRLPSTASEYPEWNDRGPESACQMLIGLTLDGDYGIEGHKRAEDALPNPDTPEEVRAIWNAALGAEPTITWDSGHGVNGFWALKEPIPVPRGEEGALLLKRWKELAVRFGDRVIREATDRDVNHDSVPEMNRLMRVPGTINAKKGCTPVLSRLISVDGPRYTIEELEEIAPPMIEAEDGSLVDPISGVVVRGPRPVVTRSENGGATSWPEGSERPGDHFNREMWANGCARFMEMIQGDGYQLLGYRRGGIADFERPGKEGSGENGASLGANDGLGAMNVGAKFWSYSTNNPGLFGVTKSEGGCYRLFLSPFEYLAFRDFDGDRSACGKALCAQGYGTRRSNPDAVSYTDMEGMWAGQEMGNKVVDIPGQRSTVDEETEDSGQTGEGEKQRTPYWDNPIPLEEEAPKPYKLELLGDLGEYTKCAADAIAVPHGMALMMNIGAVSTAIGGRRVVKVRHKWNEPVILHTLALAPPGSRKSAAQGQAFAQILAEEDKRRYAEAAEVLLDQNRRSMLEDRIKETRKKIITGKNGSHESEAELESLIMQKAQMGPEKQPLRMTASDITPEELANLMARQGERMTITESEASFLANISGQYSTGGRPKLDLVLSSYDHQKVTVDRVSKEEPVMLLHPSLTIAIAVQGDSITGLGKSCAEMDKKGAWGRFMYDVSPNHNVRTRYTPEIPEDVENRHNERIKALMAKCYDDTEVREMTLTDEAADVFFDEYYVPGDPNLKADHYRVRIKGWDDKQPGRAIRLAALITLYENPDAKEIGADVMRNVIALDETMTAHAHRASGFMTLTANDPLAPARDVLDWIEGQMFTQDVAAAQVQAAMRRQRRPWCVRLDDVLDALTVLEEYGHIKFPFINKNGDPEKRVFLVHPQYEGERPEATEASQEAPEDAERPEPVILDLADQKKEETNEERLLREAALKLTAFSAEFCQTGDHADHWVFTQELLEAFGSYSSDDGWLDAKRMGLIVKRVFPESKRTTKRVGGKQLPIYRGVSLIPSK